MMKFIEQLQEQETRKKQKTKESNTLSITITLKTITMNIDNKIAINEHLVDGKIGYKMLQNEQLDSIAEEFQKEELKRKQELKEAHKEGPQRKKMKEGTEFIRPEYLANAQVRTYSKSLERLQDRRIYSIDCSYTINHNDGSYVILTRV
jgi:hypothetical protein